MILALEDASSIGIHFEEAGKALSLTMKSTEICRSKTLLMGRFVLTTSCCFFTIYMQKVCFSRIFDVYVETMKTLLIAHNNLKLYQSQ